MVWYGMVVVDHISWVDYILNQHHKILIELMEKHRFGEKQLR